MERLDEVKAAQQAQPLPGPVHGHEMDPGLGALQDTLEQATQPVQPDVAGALGGVALGQGHEPYRRFPTLEEIDWQTYPFPGRVNPKFVTVEDNHSLAVGMEPVSLRPTSFRYAGGRHNPVAPHQRVGPPAKASEAKEVIRRAVSGNPDKLDDAMDAALAKRGVPDMVRRIADGDPALVHLPTREVLKELASRQAAERDRRQQELEIAQVQYDARQALLDAAARQRNQSQRSGNSQPRPSRSGSDSRGHKPGKGNKNGNKGGNQPKPKGGRPRTT